MQVCWRLLSQQCRLVQSLCQPARASRASMSPNQISLITYFFIQFNVRPLIYIFFYSISKIFYSYNSRTHLCKMGLLPVSVLKAHYNVTYIMQGTIYMVPHAWEISGMELHFRAQYLGPVSHSIRLYTLVGKTSISTSIVVGTGTYAWY